MITVYFDGKYLAEGESRLIEVKDLNGGAIVQITIEGGDLQGVPVQLKPSQAGYGRCEYRNITNNSAPITSSFLREGEHISP